MSDELQLDAIACYTRIYEWLQHNARREAEQKLSPRVSLDRALELVEA
jgi:hypothetical protein